MRAVHCTVHARVCVSGVWRAAQAERTPSTRPPTRRAPGGEREARAVAKEPAARSRVPEAAVGGPGSGVGGGGGGGKGAGRWGAEAQCRHCARTRESLRAMRVVTSLRRATLPRALARASRRPRPPGRTCSRRWRLSAARPPRAAFPWPARNGGRRARTVRGHKQQKEVSALRAVRCVARAAAATGAAVRASPRRIP